MHLTQTFKCIGNLRQRGTNTKEKRTKTTTTTEEEENKDNNNNRGERGQQLQQKTEEKSTYLKEKEERREKLPFAYVRQIHPPFSTQPHHNSQLAVKSSSHTSVKFIRRFLRSLIATRNSP